MNLFGCGCTRSCTLLAAIASAVIGGITAILQLIGAICLSPVFLWAAFGIAVVYLAITAVTAARSEQGEACGGLCAILRAVLTGILGTVLFSLILILIPYAACGLIGAIIVGLLLFSFALILTSTGCLVKCLTDCDD